MELDFFSKVTLLVSQKKLKIFQMYEMVHAVYKMKHAKEFPIL